MKKVLLAASLLLSGVMVVLLATLSGTLVVNKNDVAKTETSEKPAVEVTLLDANTEKESKVVPVQSKEKVEVAEDNKKVEESTQPEPKKEEVSKPVVTQEKREVKPAAPVKKEVAPVKKEVAPVKKEVAQVFTPQVTNIQKKSVMSTVSLNVRNGVGVSAGRIGSMSPYKKYTATKSAKAQDGNTWFYIEEIKGWASGAYVKDYAEVKQPAAPSNTSKPQNSAAKKYKPNTIYYGNKAVPYRNSGRSGGQATIDKTNNASTWGGASTFSGLDGMNTHLIGHNGGRNQFGGMHNHSTFIVTDAQGRAFKYVKTSLYVVDEYGVRTSDGKNMWDRIVGTGGGERIVLQSTKKHPLKWIVEAKFVEQVQ